VHKLVVIEVPIIHEINVAYCKCSKSDDADNLEQLLRNAWYPAMVTDPGTCSTFRSLETYRLCNVVGNMNVRDFITSLERMTDASAASGMTWLPVCGIVRFGRMKLTARIGPLQTVSTDGPPVGVPHAPEASRAGARPAWYFPHSSGGMCGEMLGLSSRRTKSAGRMAGSGSQVSVSLS
jgi:hypothetical protein